MLLTTISAGVTTMNNFDVSSLKPVAKACLSWHLLPRAWRLIAGACVATSLLSACSLIPAYERPAAPVPAQYPGAVSAVNASLQAADVPWQDLFKDARLKQLIALALENNRDLRMAMLKAALLILVEQNQEGLTPRGHRRHSDVPGERLQVPG